MASLAAMFGCAGPRLGAAERGFFARVDPAGFILFARNVEDRAQLRSLVAELRESVGRAQVPVLVDRGGGGGERLSPPHGRAARPRGGFAGPAPRTPPAAIEAGRLNAGPTASDWAGMAIDPVWAPSPDRRLPGAHQFV